MASTSSPVDHEDLARCLWTIGDLTRLQLLARLPETPECEHGQSVSRLAEELGLTQSTVSSHLARLRTLGIVRPSRKCREVVYYVDAARAEQIVEDLRQALKLRKAAPSD